MVFYQGLCCSFVHSKDRGMSSGSVFQPMGRYNVLRHVDCNLLTQMQFFLALLILSCAHMRMDLYPLACLFGEAKEIVKVC